MTLSESVAKLETFAQEFEKRDSNFHYNILISNEDMRLIISNGEVTTYVQYGTDDLWKGPTFTVGGVDQAVVLVSLDLGLLPGF